MLEKVVLRCRHELARHATCATFTVTEEPDASFAPAAGLGADHQCLGATSSV